MSDSTAIVVMGKRTVYDSCTVGVGQVCGGCYGLNVTCMVNSNYENLMDAVKTTYDGVMEVMYGNPYDMGVANGNWDSVLSKWY